MSIAVDEAVRATFKRSPSTKVELYSETLDVARFNPERYGPVLAAYLREKFADRKLDLIITSLPQAVRFLLKFRKDLFPETPIIYCLADEAELAGLTKTQEVIGVPLRIPWRETLDLALAIHTDTRNVVVIAGTDGMAQVYLRQVHRLFQPYENQLAFTYVTNRTLGQLLKEVASLPPHSVIIYTTIAMDGAGQVYIDAEVSGMVAKAANAPAYSVSSTYLGRGITGGRIIDYGAHATRAAEMGLRVLAGEKPEGIIAGDVPNPPMFDARQLSRWMISEKRLPAGSIVQFEEPSRWESYRPVILILIVCLLEALLILALLIYRQRRRKAEERLRENEERLRLAMSAAALDVWSWDIPRDRIRLSQQVGKMLPETPTAEVTYKDFLALVHPEDRERVDAAIQRAIRTEKEYECDFRLAHRDGTMQWISSRGSCSYNRSGPLRMNGVSQDITERKRAELALRESEQRFRKMTDAAHMMVWMSGPDKGCIFFNQSWLNFTGRRLEQEVGDGWTEGVHPEDVERIIREYSRAFDAWEPFELEYRLRHFDGEYRWIVDVGTPLYEEDGRFCGYLGSCLDITERKRADEGRQLLAAVVESSDDAILSFDLDTRVTSWNPGAERLFGFAEAEVKGKPAWFHVPPESREQTMRALERIKAGQATSWEGVRCRKDGALIEVSISSAPIRNTVGEIVGGTTTLRDITPRKRAERELRESEERFRTLFEESPLAIGVSRQGRVLYTNKTYLEMFGYGSVEELRGQTVREQWAPECHEALAKRTLRRELGLPLPAEFEGLGLRKDGSQFPVHAFATRAQLADGMANIAFLTDVTERKRAEGEVDRLRRELAHMSRVTMMGELTASLAHELNQPLTAIVSNAHAGERYLAGPTPPLEELRAILADVSADAQRAGEVIRRLRGLLKKDTTRFLPLDLNELIREVVALTQTDALIRHQPIALTLAPDLPPIRGDRVQLQQVLLNLVLNGMEAMEPLPATARQLSLQTLPAGTAVRVAVQDRGPGIPSDKRETIFDAFVTTKTQGLGMGLAISRSIVEAHGGRIWVENNPERGATFWFSLPV